MYFFWLKTCLKVREKIEVPCLKGILISEFRAFDEENIFKSLYKNSGLEIIKKKIRNEFHS